MCSVLSITARFPLRKLQKPCSVIIVNTKTTLAKLPGKQPPVAKRAKRIPWFGSRRGGDREEPPPVEGTQLYAAVLRALRTNLRPPNASEGKGAEGHGLSESRELPSTPLPRGSR